MTIEKIDSEELDFDRSPKVAVILSYLSDSSAPYRNRFAKGYLPRRPDESIDPEALKLFSDQKALRFLGEHVLELYGSSERKSVYLHAGDVVLNAEHNRIRFHAARIAAVLEGKDPDDFLLPPIDFDNPDRYVQYSRASGNSELLRPESVFLPGKKYDSGIACSYDFSRSFPTDEIPTIGISGITYLRSQDSEA